MAKDNGGKNTEDKYNMIANIVQIILNHYMVYVLKFVVFIFIVCTINVKWNNINEINASDLMSFLTFVTPVLIDAFVLSRSVRVKGKINLIFFIYIVLLLIGDGFIFLVISGKSPVSLFSVCVCDFVNIFCCLSPILELIYGIISHMQIEREKEYN